MASFGENLRRERELRGVTLAELAEATKVSVRYLTALENDQFDRLPGGVFNRGFVRSVARYLGLDEREWVGAFVHAAREEPEILARYAPAPPAARTPRQSWTGFVLLLVLFGAGLFAVHSVRARRAAETLPALFFPKAKAPEPASQAAAATSTPIVPTANASLTKPAPSNQPPTVQAEETLIDLQLQVFSIEDAWVSISADGRILYEGMMKPRETRVFRADSHLDVRTGNASALVLTLNGETLAPLGNPGEVRTISLSRKDLATARP